VKNTVAAALVAVVALASGRADAQIQTLTQSTNSITITAGNTPSCNGGAPGFVHTDNGYWRSYPLASIGSSIDVVSITFAVEAATSTLPNGQPMIIRLYNDPTPAAIGPVSGLQLRHTENFNLANATSVLITQPITGPTVTFTSTETLVVEVFSPAGAANGNASFFFGSNTAGETATGFLRAAACGAAEPVTFASLGAAFANVHIILDVNYVQSGTTLFYPGTNEDLTISSAVNANPLTSGVGSDVKNVVATDNITIFTRSLGGAFNFREFILAGQAFPTGNPPLGIAPNLHVNIPGVVLLVGGDFGPLGPVLLPPAGITVSFTVPPSLAGMGLSAIFQPIIISPTALNGLYAAAEAHEFIIQ
jgi:hypothetical protein